MDFVIRQPGLAPSPPTRLLLFGTCSPFLIVISFRKGKHLQVFISLAFGLDQIGTLQRWSNQGG